MVLATLNSQLVRPAKGFFCFCGEVFQWWHGVKDTTYIKAKMVRGQTRFVQGLPYVSVQGLPYVSVQGLPLY